MFDQFFRSKFYHGFHRAGINVLCNTTYNFEKGPRRMDASILAQTLYNVYRRSCVLFHVNVRPILLFIRSVHVIYPVSREICRALCSNHVRLDPLRPGNRGYTSIYHTSSDHFDSFANSNQTTFAAAYTRNRSEINLHLGAPLRRRVYLITTFVRLRGEHENGVKK